MPQPQNSLSGLETLSAASRTLSKSVSSVQRIDASLLEGALADPVAAGAAEVRDGPPLAVDRGSRCVARGVELAVVLLEVLLERVDLVDDVQEVQLGRAAACGSACRARRRPGRPRSASGPRRRSRRTPRCTSGRAGSPACCANSLILASIRALWSGWKSRDWTTVNLPLILTLANVGRPGAAAVGAAAAAGAVVAAARWRGRGWRRRGAVVAAAAGAVVGAAAGRSRRRGGGGAVVGAGVAADWQAADTVMAAADRKL